MINNRQVSDIKKFEIINIDMALEEAEQEANNPNTKYYSHKEMKQMARRIIDGK